MPKSQTRRRNFHQGEREYRKLRLATHRTSDTVSQLLTERGQPDRRSRNRAGTSLPHHP